MKRSSDLYFMGIKLTPYMRGWANSARFAMIIMGLSVMAWNVSAQTVTWTDSFVRGEQPTGEQCLNWTGFLDQLGNKSFTSVKLSGSNAPNGITLTDPAAATKLAGFLSSRSKGAVQFGNDIWAVTICDDGACGTPNIALSINGDTEKCQCTDTYAVRPHATNANWGGLDGETCNAPSQTMTLEFTLAVFITAEGPTTICEGGSVQLTANTSSCSSSVSFEWSNGATTQSITATEPGDYFVTVSGAEGCNGTSNTISVQTTEISVSAGEDVVFCEDDMEAVQLTATGISENTGGTSTTKLCLFDVRRGGSCAPFSSSICDDGADQITEKIVSSEISALNPTELTLRIYYSHRLGEADFAFKLNGQQFGSYRDTNATGGSCDDFGTYPVSLTFTQSQFITHWNGEGSNTLSVEILGDLFLSGIVAEVVTSNEFYSWSPAEGLDNALIQNPLASPDKTTLYTVTFTDANGCTATDQVEVAVKCANPPVVACQEVSVSVDENCEAIVDASQFDGGSTGASELTFSVSPAGPYPVGTTEVTLTVTDASGESGTCSTTITATDSTLPVIATLEDLTVPNDPGACFATIALTQPETSDNCGVESVSNDHGDNIFPEGETIVTWTVEDIHGNTQSTTQKITVVNATSVINSVDVSDSSVGINIPVVLTVSYTDNNVSTATIDWGDFSAIETVANPETIFEVSHAYASSGSYSVAITLTDECGQSIYVYKSIMVSNDRGGSVSGGGWFNSPHGAYTKDPRASGKATFAMQASSSAGNEPPKGHIVFNFQGGKIKFRSSYFEWLKVTDESASIKAVGRLNGTRDYQILISVAEDIQEKGKDKGKGNGKNNSKEGIDHIRVKIWDPSGKVVYDTQFGSSDEAIATTPLGGGSIKVEVKESVFSDSYTSPVATSFGEESSSAYPNPFNDWVDVQFNASTNESVIFQLLDLSGKVIYNEVFPVSSDGRYSLNIPENRKAQPGIYVLIIKQGKRVEFLRMVRE